MTWHKTARPWRPLAAGLCLIALAACETLPTPYEPAGEEGGFGLSEAQIDGETWRISFAGNEYTTREQVENSVLYRAAEIADDAGADGFLVLKEELESDLIYERRGYRQFAHPYFGFRSFGRRYDGFGSFASRRVFPYRTRQTTNYTASVRVRLFSGEPPEGLGTPYDATALLKSLRPAIAPPPAASGQTPVNSRMTPLDSVGATIRLAMPVRRNGTADCSRK